MRSVHFCVAFALIAFISGRMAIGGDFVKIGDVIIVHKSRVVVDWYFREDNSTDWVVAIIGGMGGETFTLKCYSKEEERPAHVNRTAKKIVEYLNSDEDSIFIQPIIENDGWENCSWK